MKKAIFAVAAMLALSSAFAANAPASTSQAAVATSGPATASFVCAPLKPSNPGIRIKDPCYPPPPPPPTGA